MKVNRQETIEKYKDIIYRTYVKSQNRPHMSNYDRAMQFAPFAALTGHKEAISETGRKTESKNFLDENVIDVLNLKINRILESEMENLVLKITYFLTDERKAGGRYVCNKGIIKKIDEINHIIHMDNGVSIPLGDVMDIQCDEIEIE